MGGNRCILMFVSGKEHAPRCEILRGGGGELPI